MGEVGLILFLEEGFERRVLVRRRAIWDWHNNLAVNSNGSSFTMAYIGDRRVEETPEQALSRLVSNINTGNKSVLYTLAHQPRLIIEFPCGFAVFALRVRLEFVRRLPDLDSLLPVTESELASFSGSGSSMPPVQLMALREIFGKLKDGSLEQLRTAY